MFLSGTLFCFCTRARFHSPVTPAPLKLFRSKKQVVQISTELLDQVGWHVFARIRAKSAPICCSLSFPVDFTGPEFRIQIPSLTNYHGY
jgi:hypothetical protein